ncbi:cysteine proteinase, partial [Lentinus tigrinus ALCF2SS1-6]
YHRGAAAELAKDFDKAFRMYVKATEQYLHLSNRTTDVRLRTLYKTEAAKSLERAERIKAFRRDVAPVLKDELSAGEQLYILRKSSLINQGFFPPWDSQESPTSSSVQPSLSAEQIAQSATWRRYSDFNEHNLHRDVDLEPQDVMQHIISDCSVCAAIVVAIDHDRRFASKMVSSSLHPQAEPDQFQCKLLFNGTFRRVRIDSQLPTYSDGTLMCVSTGTKGQLWPSLIEKAYMKLAGGYDFVGSLDWNSSSALAGWIPEVLDMKGSKFQREKTWSRLLKGYTSGNCVATLGTGERVRVADTSLALLPTHCYAIIGVNESQDNRRLTIFDPWLQRSVDEERASTEVSTEAEKRKLFDLSMDSVYQLFDGLYFSWNPAMFKHQMSFHGYAVYGHAFKATIHARMQVQLEFPLNVSEGETVWILLTRHVRSHRSKDEYIALTAHTGSGSIAASASDVLSTKVRGEYTNSPHVLVKQTIAGPEDIITLIASYEGEREDVGYTITLYSNYKATANPPKKLLYTKDIEGAFTQKTAGGNNTYPTYYLNPQYHLRVHPHTDVVTRTRDVKAQFAVAASADRHIPVNIMLAWSQGGRINELGHNDIALSSGPYSYGYAHATGIIPPGDYTLVVSAFEPLHLGKFALRLECSDRFEITPILQEGAGMFSKHIRGEWTAESAGGGPSSGTYTSNPMYELNVPSPTKLKFRLQLSEPSPSLALNLTVFNTSTGTTLGRHVATSGPYSDALSGVVIENLTLQPGRYLVVPSTYKPGMIAAFRLIVYSTVSGVQLSPVKR